MRQRTYRLLLSDCPSADESREVLELVLAAASLDFKLELVVEGGALALVTPSMLPGWQQLLDEELADVILSVPPGWHGAVPPGARVVDIQSVPVLPASAIELTL